MQGRPLPEGISDYMTWVCAYMDNLRDTDKGRKADGSLQDNKLHRAVQDTIVKDFNTIANSGDVERLNAIRETFKQDNKAGYDPCYKEAKAQVAGKPLDEKSFNAAADAFVPFMRQQAEAGRKIYQEVMAMEPGLYNRIFDKMHDKSREEVAMEAAKSYIFGAAQFAGAKAETSEKVGDIRFSQLFYASMPYLAGTVDSKTQNPIAMYISGNQSTIDDNMLAATLKQEIEANPKMSAFVKKYNDTVAPAAVADARQTQSAPPPVSKKEEVAPRRTASTSAVVAKATVVGEAKPATKMSPEQYNKMVEAKAKMEAALAKEKEAKARLQAGGKVDAAPAPKIDTAKGPTITKSKDDQTEVSGPPTKKGV